MSKWNTFIGHSDNDVEQIPIHLAECKFQFDDILSQPNLWLQPQKKFSMSHKDNRIEISCREHKLAQKHMLSFCL